MPRIFAGASSRHLPAVAVISYHSIEQARAAAAALVAQGKRVNIQQLTRCAFEVREVLA